MSKFSKPKPGEVSCVDCKAWACFPDVSAAKTGRREPPLYCPANSQKQVCEEALAKYAGETHEFARTAALVENACYMIDPITGSAVLPMITLHPRAEEIIMFAKIADYKKLGIAFCAEMQEEAETYTNILENNGFDVVSVCCKAGASPKVEIGVNKEVDPHDHDSNETMCSGLIMAELLNSEKTDMNILMGICVGQDALFYKYAEAFSVPLVIMDRVYGGATMEGVYQVFNSWGYRNYTDKISNGFELMRSAMLQPDEVAK